MSEHHLLALRFDPDVGGGMGMGGRGLSAF